MQEKRKNKRLNICAETLLSKPDGLKTGVKLVDISLGGMKVLMNEGLKPETILLGELNILPQSGPFYIRGEVSWVRPCADKDNSYSFETGIKFNKITTIPI